MVTESPADHVRRTSDLVRFCLFTPFGWGGSPSHFARFGDSVTISHRRFGLSIRNTLLQHSLRPALYVDDGILVEVDIAGRLQVTTQCWERLTIGILGTEALNEDKLIEEGAWGAQQILLGFVFNMDRLTIPLPGDKIAGPSVLFWGFLLSDWIAAHLLVGNPTITWPYRAFSVH